MLEKSRFQTVYYFGNWWKVFENIIGFVSIIIIFVVLNYSSLNSPKYMKLKLMQMDDARFGLHLQIIILVCF